MIDATFKKQCTDCQAHIELILLWLGEEHGGLDGLEDIFGIENITEAGVITWACECPACGKIIPLWKDAIVEEDLRDPYMWCAPEDITKPQCKFNELPANHNPCQRCMGGTRGRLHNFDKGIKVPRPKHYEAQ